MKKVSKPWWVYIIECSDNTYYTGITTDVQKRIITHNNGKGAKYTKYRGPVELRYCKEIGTKSMASKEEFEIKKLTKKQKLILIESCILPT